MSSKTKTKQDQVLEKFYRYFAQHGFLSLHNVSHLTKGVGISRSLFYFYFKDTEDLLQQIKTLHLSKVEARYDVIQEHQHSFLDYLHNTVVRKDIYFITVQSSRHVGEHPAFGEMLEAVVSSVDHYNFTQFIKHYGLEGLSEHSVKLMYDSFRSSWFAHSQYEGWTHERVDELISQLDEMISLLRVKAHEEALGEGDLS